MPKNPPSPSEDKPDLDHEGEPWPEPAWPNPGKFTWNEGDIQTLQEGEPPDPEEEEEEDEDAEEEIEEEDVPAAIKTIHVYEDEDGDLSEGEPEEE
jgi:hypothetical protein